MALATRLHLESFSNPTAPHKQLCASSLRLLPGEPASFTGSPLAHAQGVSYLLLGPALLFVLPSPQPSSFTPVDSFF